MSMETTLNGTELTAEAKTGNKQWVAVITDTHPRYNFERDFVAYQKPKTSDRDSGRTTLEEGAVIESVRYTHSGKNDTRWYYQFAGGDLHQIDETDVRDALEGIIVEVEDDENEPEPVECRECPECATECASEHGVAVHMGIAHSEDDETTNASETNTETQVVAADGGDSSTDHIPDKMISAAIERKDTPGHEDAMTIPRARELLAEVQQSLIGHWDLHLDAIDEGHVEIVHEDQDIIVLADHTGHGWNEEFDALDIDDTPHKRVILDVVHQLANKHCDYSWSASDPFVLAKPEQWKVAEMHARRSIAKLTRESGSVARGTDRWATERQGLTQKDWGDEHTGTDRAHQNIGKNARRGREEAAKQR